MLSRSRFAFVGRAQENQSPSIVSRASQMIKGSPAAAAVAPAKKCWHEEGKGEPC